MAAKVKKLVTKGDVKTETVKPVSTEVEDAARVARAYLMEHHSAGWQAYFPVRVEFNRQEMYRVVAALLVSRDRFQREGENFARDMAEKYSALSANMDSILKFPRDENFILLTKTEYDKLTQSEENTNRIKP